jgi:hypothetical protein
MSDLEIILEKLFSLGLEDTKRLEAAVSEHLDELNEVVIHEGAKADDDDTVPLKSIISEFQEDLEEGSR